MENNLFLVANLIFKLNTVLGLSMMVERPERAGIVLKRLYAERPIKIWPFAPTILKFLPNTLDSNVSRYIQGKLLLIIVNLRRKMSLVRPSSIRLPF